MVNLGDEVFLFHDRIENVIEKNGKDVEEAIGTDGLDVVTGLVLVRVCSGYGCQATGSKFVQDVDIRIMLAKKEIMIVQHQRYELKIRIWPRIWVFC